MITLNGRGMFPAWTDPTQWSRQLVTCDGVSTTLASETSERGSSRRHEEPVIKELLFTFFHFGYLKEISKWLVDKIAQRTATNEITRDKTQFRKPLQQFDYTHCKQSQQTQMEKSTASTTADKGYGCFM